MTLKLLTQQSDAPQQQLSTTTSAMDPNSPQQVQSTTEADGCIEFGIGHKVLCLLLQDCPQNEIAVDAHLARLIQNMFDSNSEERQ